MSATYLDVNTVKAQVARLQLEHPEVAEDAELMADSLEGETNLHELATRLIRFDREAAMFAKAIRAQETELATRRTRFERRQEVARQFMHSLLEVAGTNKLMLPEATLTIVKGKLGCVITDEVSLPDEYVETKRVPRKQDITKALTSGKDVPGAILKNGAPHLMIRVA